MPGIARPPTTANGLSPFGFWDQDAVWQEPCFLKLGEADPKFNKEVITAQGLTIDDTARVTACFLSEGVSVQKVFASDTDAERMREDILGELKQDKAVPVNILRNDMGECGGGHWSPIIAYHPGSESFLFS